MNLLFFTLGLLLLFGGGGFYLAGPAIGGEVVGMILLIGVIIYWVGGFRPKV
jgi:hypothetical protein